MGGGLLGFAEGTCLLVTHDKRSGRRGYRDATEMASLKTFRLIAVTEAFSFLILLASSVLKRSDGWELGVQVLGPLHGVLFAAYVLIAVSIREREGWRTRQTGGILAAAVLPFGGFAAERWLAKNETAENSTPPTKTPAG